MGLFSKFFVIISILFLTCIHGATTGQAELVGAEIDLNDVEEQISPSNENNQRGLSEIDQTPDAEQISPASAESGSTTDYKKQRMQIKDSCDHATGLVVIIIALSIILYWTVVSADKDGLFKPK
jgi:hypothetical protein